ncbi:MAG: helix-turn-helix transcriptional regulator [Candidatus Nanohaloarchaeota archaeon]|nr:helix-turn-helix transcriptional regulator [Candidatus Nanohaloarchaeota archaeon]
MVEYKRSIKIVEKRYPESHTTKDMLEWIAISLGVSTKRDLEGTLLKIMEIILSKAKNSQPVKIEELAKKIHISKSTAHHHLEKMYYAGILEKTKKGYYLKGRNLEETIEEIELEIKRIMERIKKVAKEIDEQIF